ncbi:uncharacterized protein RJT20DRAFT_130379 [Scheffersomyces xylosifermentans]|uniref:uncharacterized protein n=1 Tax=Scheffersomyces xylosifermentans TaxID=1304137 RepID=UPI00315D795D
MSLIYKGVSRTGIRSVYGPVFSVRYYASKQEVTPKSQQTSEPIETKESPENSTEEPVGRPIPVKSPEEARREAQQLAIQSLKDVGSLFSSAGDEATQPIDTSPVYKDNSLFGTLSLLHQGQVLKELQDKYDKKWKKLTLEEKRLGYYIAYGDWGVREEFKNWRTLEPPHDLPFRVPSQIKTTNPTKDTIIKKLEPVILGETPIRIKQFDYKKMDGVTKFFIYLTLFISVAAIFRDKKIGEEGKPVEVIIEDPYEKDRLLREEQRKEAEMRRKIEEQIALEKSKKKWYYLWLK